MNDLTTYSGGDREFAAWLKRVDAQVSKRVGLGLFDLPDVPLREMFDDGTTAAAAAKEALSAAGWED